MVDLEPFKKKTLKVLDPLKILPDLLENKPAA